MIRYAALAAFAMGGCGKDEPVDTGAPATSPSTDTELDTMSDTDTDTDTAPAIEPLVLPEDPAATGVPVGVRTFDVDGAAIEVWYPAPDAVGFDVTEVVDANEFVPQAFVDHVGPVVLPSWTTPVLRDAAVRPVGEPLPIVLFSHGLAGMRVQSLDYAIHLASRGYVVVSMDHPGRMMGDALVCLFDPALPECELGGLFVDPALEDVPATLDWLEAAAADGPLAGALDLERIALTGFSAGGGTTTGYDPADERIAARIAVAGGGTFTAAVPSLVIGGTCDAFGGADGLAAVAAGAGASFVRVGGAGHLGFSDLCDLDLIGLADEWLADRDDLSGLLYPTMRDLASDGCPGFTPPELEGCDGSYRAVDEVLEIQRYYTTVFLDDVFRGEGPGLSGDVYAEVTVE
jgi:dienelactone hydrolase